MEQEAEEEITRLSATRLVNPVQSLPKGQRRALAFVDDRQRAVHLSCRPD